MVKFYHISSDINPANVLSKHWGHLQAYTTLRLLLFYRGNSLEILKEED